MNARGAGLQGAAVGLALGLTHAIAETTSLGWYGLGLTIGDVACLLVAYGLAAAAAGAAAALLLASLRIPQRWCAPLLLAGYVAVAGWILETIEPIGRRRAALAAVAVAALLVLPLVASGARGALSRLAALLALAFAASGAVSFALEIDSIPEDRRLSLALCFAAPALAGLVVAILARRAVPQPAWPRAAGLALGLALADLALFLGPLPRAMRWHVLESAPPAGIAAQPGPGRPDVILLVLDTVRADHLDFFGYGRATMPKLAAWARSDCALATRVTATAPSSLPSHATMFTGLFAASHGARPIIPTADDEEVPLDGRFLREDVPTLAELLAGLGYHTAGFAANFGVLSSYGLQRGFQRFDAAAGAQFYAMRLPWLKAFKMRERPAGGLVRMALPESFTERTVCFSRRLAPYRHAREINDEAIAWLEEHAGAPRFLFLNYFDAHDPYLPVPWYDECFRARPSDLSWFGFPPLQVYDPIVRGAATLPAGHLEYLRAQYDAGLRHMDDEIARLVDELKACGRYDDALLIVTSDHGESFLEHGLLRHSTQLYDAQVSVPLFLKLPKGRSLPQGATRLQFVDFLPTILDLLDAPIPENVEGRPFGEGRDFELSEMTVYSRRWPRLTCDLASVRLGERKFLRRVRGDEVEELVFDLAKDPLEQRNLLGEDPEFEAKARRVLAWRDSRVVTAPSGGDDRALRAKLQALGYAEAR